MKEQLLDRLLTYVKIDTQSDENATCVPSTDKQFDLARMLAAQLSDLGMDRVELDEKCYVYAHLNSNIPKDHDNAISFPKIGFVAHLDTAQGTSGANVNPQVIDRYTGGDIQVNDRLTLTVADNPHLKDSVGQTLVTTDGTTLLGADDKSGIAIIMTVLEELTNNPDILHPDIRVAFTPDEEIGRGALHFNLEKFDADVAYTIDGGPAGEINMETFSADSALITISGKDTHPGEAKNIMVSALKAATALVEMLPKDMAPETTHEQEPFIHPYKIEGSVANAVVKCLLRAFDTAALRKEAILLEEIIAKVEQQYPGVTIDLEIKKNYRNMRDTLETVPLVTDHLEAAVRQAGLTPKWVPIRGGTDGSGLTARGLPCPNIFTGGHNFHGPMEWISVDIMEKSAQTLLNLLKIWINDA